MVTTVTAGTGLVSCDLDVDLTATGGQIEALLNDNPDAVGFEYVRIDLEDMPQTACDLGLLGEPKLEIVDFHIVADEENENYTPYQPVVPHTQGEHDAGTVDGDQDSEHYIRAYGTLFITDNVLGMEDGESELDLPGVMPPGTVSITDTGGTLRIVFDAPAHELLNEDLEGGINITLTGLVGEVNYTP